MRNVVGVCFQTAPALIARRLRTKRDELFALTAVKQTSRCKRGRLPRPVSSNPAPAGPEHTAANRPPMVLPRELLLDCLQSVLDESPFEALQSLNAFKRTQRFAGSLVHDLGPGRPYEALREAVTAANQLWCDNGADTNDDLARQFGPVLGCLSPLRRERALTLMKEGHGRSDRNLIDLCASLRDMSHPERSWLLAHVSRHPDPVQHGKILKAFALGMPGGASPIWDKLAEVISDRTPSVAANEAMEGLAGRAGQLSGAAQNRLVDDAVSSPGAMPGVAACFVGLSANNCEWLLQAGLQQTDPEERAETIAGFARNLRNVPLRFHAEIFDAAFVTADHSPCASIIAGLGESLALVPADMRSRLMTRAIALPDEYERSIALTGLAEGFDQLGPDQRRLFDAAAAITASDLRANVFAAIARHGACLSASLQTRLLDVWRQTRNDELLEAIGKDLPAYPQSSQRWLMRELRELPAEARSRAVAFLCADAAGLPDAEQKALFDLILGTSQRGPGLVALGRQFPRLSTNSRNTYRQLFAELGESDRRLALRDRCHGIADRLDATFS